MSNQLLIDKAIRLANNLRVASDELKENAKLLEALDKSPLRYNQYEKVVQKLNDLIETWGTNHS